MQDLKPAKAYLLPESLRNELGLAFGPVVSTEYLKDHLAGATVVAVGDQVSLSCKEAGVTPNLIVVDYRTRRGALSASYQAAFGTWGGKEWRVVNPAGVLTRESWQAVTEALADPGPYPARIVVDGEEDLLGIPCFLEAPDSTKVLYGMPGQGVCVVTVDAAFRRKVRKILQGFIET